MRKLPFIACLAVVAAFCGCSRQDKFVQRLAAADRVVATNAAQAFGIEVTSVKPKQIVTAISSARKNATALASPDLRLEFFKGSNLLETVDLCVNCFGINGVQYVDSSGVLEAVDDEYHKKYMAEQIRSSH
jgi:hypothetical protein